MNFCWNVYHYDFNKRKIEPYNVITKGFLDKCTELAKDLLSKEEFFKELDSWFSYHYRFRCEYEIVLSGFPESHNAFDQGKEKIDIYEQIKLNWEIFKLFLEIKLPEYFGGYPWKL